MLTVRVTGGTNAGHRIIKPPQPKTHWTCADCGKTHPYFILNCSNCGVHRPGR